VRPNPLSTVKWADSSSVCQPGQPAIFELLRPGPVLIDPLPDFPYVLRRIPEKAPPPNPAICPFKPFPFRAKTSHKIGVNIKSCTTWSELWLGLFKFLGNFFCSTFATYKW